MTTPSSSDIANKNNDTLTHRPITSFKAYDIRGELGVNLDEDIAYRIGRAFAQILASQKADSESNETLENSIVIGCDIRDSSETLKQATIRGIVESGCYPRASSAADFPQTGSVHPAFWPLPGGAHLWARPWQKEPQAALAVQLQQRAGLTQSCAGHPVAPGQCPVAR